MKSPEGQYVISASRPWVDAPEEDKKKRGPKGRRDAAVLGYANTTPVSELEACLNCTRPADQCTGVCFTPYRKGKSRINRQGPPPDLLRRIENGQTRKELATHYGVSSPTITNWANKLGYYFPTQRKQRKGGATDAI